MIDRAWLRMGRKGLPNSLREDFAGSCAVAAEWVRRRAVNTAVCIDLDAEVLAFAKERHIGKLTASAQRRIRTVRKDVTKAKYGPFDVAVALNFSYYIFKKRTQLVSYFRHLRRDLGPRGIVLLDAYGGADALREISEDRRLDGFNYVWETESYNPITGEVMMAIHFEFPDGSKMRRAFTYDWRLWSIPEVCEALIEAGFRDPTVYWEGNDRRTGGGNGIFRPSTKGEACDGWVAYIAARI